MYLILGAIIVLLLIAIGYYKFAEGYFVNRYIYMPSYAGMCGHRCHPGTYACGARLMKCPSSYYEVDPMLALGRKCQTTPDVKRWLKYGAGDVNSKTKLEHMM